MNFQISNLITKITNIWTLNLKIWINNVRTNKIKWFSSHFKQLINLLNIIRTLKMKFSCKINFKITCHKTHSFIVKSVKLIYPSNSLILSTNYWKIKHCRMPNLMIKTVLRVVKLQFKKGNQITTVTHKAKLGKTMC